MRIKRIQKIFTILNQEKDSSVKQSIKWQKEI